MFTIIKNDSPYPRVIIEYNNSTLYYCHYGIIQYCALRKSQKKYNVEVLCARLKTRRCVCVHFYFLRRIYYLLLLIQYCREHKYFAASCGWNFTKRNVSCASRRWDDRKMYIRTRQIPRDIHQSRLYSSLEYNP